MLNAVVFSIVGDTTQILHHYGLCAVRELIRMSIKLLFLSTQTEEKEFLFLTRFLLLHFNLESKFRFVMT